MLYVGDWCDRSTITQIDLQVETIASLAGDIYSEGVNDGAALTANINRVHSMAFDKAGNIFFVDYYTHRVRFLNMTSKLISTVAGFNLTEGFENGPASVAKFERPRGIALDSNDNVYVSDLSQQIRKISYE